MDIIKRTSEIAAAVTGRNGQPAASTEDTPEPQKTRNIITPTGAWPPPIYVDASATEQETYYMEHRWYTQWSWYDTKASEAKKVYQRIQIVIGIGSVTVPVLVSLAPIANDTTGRNALTLITVLISLLVAAAAAVENVKKYGDAWRTYRSAAEDLKREKSLYDVRSGPYRKSKRPFLLFVERCEDVMAKQNGSWAALKEEQQTTTAQTTTKDEDDGA